MGSTLSGSSVHGILQVRILEWFAISSSRGSSWTRDHTHVSFTHVSMDSLSLNQLVNSILQYEIIKK